jgi:hypothetical protein
LLFVLCVTYKQPMLISIDHILCPAYHQTWLSPQKIGLGEHRWLDAMEGIGFLLETQADHLDHPNQTGRLFIISMISTTPVISITYEIPSPDGSTMEMLGQQGARRIHEASQVTQSWKGDEMESAHQLCPSTARLAVSCPPFLVFSSSSPQLLRNRNWDVETVSGEEQMCVCHENSSSQGTQKNGH